MKNAHTQQDNDAKNKTTQHNTDQRLTVMPERCGRAGASPTM
jgi:hypothetical protein